LVSEFVRLIEINVGRNRLRRTFLVRNIIGDFQEVYISQWHSNVFGLSTSESTGQMRISQHAGPTMSVKEVLELVRIGSFTLRAKFLFAIVTFAARNLEGCNYSFTGLESFDCLSDRIDLSAKLTRSH
jgi:hypothetical protein